MRIESTKSILKQNDRHVTFEDQLQNQTTHDPLQEFKTAKDTDKSNNFGEHNDNDNTMSNELIKTNLSYYKKISECRSVFIIEFQKIMEARLRLMLSKEKLLNYLREYENSFNRKHYPFY